VDFWFWIIRLGFDQVIRAGPQKYNIPTRHIERSTRESQVVSFHSKIWTMIGGLLYPSGTKWLPLMVKEGLKMAG
jgi:hypothetical protein